jgi:hypothetical protein
MKVKAILEPDADGFISQECPYCNEIFKTAFGKGSRKPHSYCPCCGNHAPNCWTVEQIQYLDSVALGEPGPMPSESAAPMAIHKFKCHRDRIKHNGSKKKLFCVVCGRRNRVPKKARV